MGLLNQLGLPPPRGLAAAAPPLTPEPRFTVQDRGQAIRGLTKSEAFDLLVRKYRRVGDGFGQALEKLRVFEELAEQQGWVTGFVEFFGAHARPTRARWKTSRIYLDRAHARIALGDVGNANSMLLGAERLLDAAEEQLERYRAGTQKTAGHTVTGLKVTAAVGAVAAGYATGGLATAKMGLAGAAALGGVGSGAYGAYQQMAGEVGEVLVDMKRDVDWKEVLKRGVSDTITGFVGGIVGGAATKQFTKLYGAHLGKLGAGELDELGKALGMKGPLPADYFLTTGQKLVAEFVGTAAQAPLTVATGIVVNRIASGAPAPANFEGFMREVAAEMAPGIASQMFVAFVTRKAPGARGSRSTASSRETADAEVPLTGGGTLGGGKPPRGPTKVPTEKIRRLPPRPIPESGPTAKPKLQPQLPEGYGDLLDQPGVGTRKTPGGKPQPTKAAAGNFAHEWAEQLPELLKSKGMRYEDVVPAGSLPEGLIAEYEIPHPDYPKKPRADRLDRSRGEVIEIGPPAQASQKAAEAKQYAEWLDRFEPLPGGRKWKGRAVIYDQKRVMAFLRKIGFLE